MDLISFVVAIVSEPGLDGPSGHQVNDGLPQGIRSKDAAHKVNSGELAGLVA
jgi:hypothetical protein